MSRKLRIEYPGKGSTVDYSQQLRLSEAVWGCFWMVFFACPGVVIPTLWHHAARHASGISWRDLSRDGSWGPPGGHFHLCRSSGLRRGCKLAWSKGLSPCSIARAVDNTNTNPRGPTNHAHNWNSSLFLERL